MKIVSVGYDQKTTTTYSTNIKSDEFHLQEIKVAIYVPEVIWPQQCVCCGGEATSEHYHLNHFVPAHTPQEYGSTTVTKNFPLEWQVPCCPSCAKHSKLSSDISKNIGFILIAIGLFCFIAVFNDTPVLSGLIFLSTAVIAGVVLYWLLMMSMVFPKKKSTCTNHAYAVKVSSDEEYIFFHFSNAEYAKLFAQMNNIQPAVCPLCGYTKIMKKANFQLLYGQKVCKKCYYSFVLRRIVAFVVDITLWYTCFRGLAAVAGDSNFYFFCLFLILFCMKDGFAGHSPGKALLGLQTIRADSGQAAGFGASFKRNLPLLIPFMPFLVSLQLLDVFVNEMPTLLPRGTGEGFRMGDEWAKTRVIWKKYRSDPIFAVGNTK